LKKKRNAKTSTLLLLGLIAGLLVAILWLSHQSDASPRAVWRSKAPSQYRMVVEYISPPVPPIIREIVVKDGEIIQQALLACDPASDIYSEATCEAIQQYYPGTGIYTIDDLFRWVDQCKLQTNAGYCTVEYDSDYGYPTTLVHYVPNALDGTSAINITAFEVLSTDS
jgi:hypothetical protein